MAEFDPDIVTQVTRLSDKARQKSILMATAESCTGGLIAGAITSLAGSSTIFDRGIVTYSNEAKNEWLKVPHDVLETHGAVSEPTAKQMVAGLFEASRADIGVSVTGVAGPGGGTAEKPVGLVYIGYGARDDGIEVMRHVFEGDREAIRRATIITALGYLEALVDRLVNHQA